ncbi:MAG TPA: hypothetical protein VFE14_11835 [Micromonosporaceae bacterium]|nr:hypothetical protein [Micromonosporaceae bacterium]
MALLERQRLTWPGVDSGNWPALVDGPAAFEAGALVYNGRDHFDAVLPPEQRVTPPPSYEPAPDTVPADTASVDTASVDTAPAGPPVAAPSRGRRPFWQLARMAGRASSAPRQPPSSVSPPRSDSGAAAEPVVTPQSPPSVASARVAANRFWPYTRLIGPAALTTPAAASSVPLEGAGRSSQRLPGRPEPVRYTDPDLVGLVRDVVSDVPPSGDNCEELLRAVRDRLYSGVRGDRPVDDLGVDSRRGREQFATTTQWPRPASLDDVIAAVSAGVGRSAFLHMRRANEPGHAIVLHHAVNGLRVIDPANPDSGVIPVSGPADVRVLVPSAVAVHALVTDPAGAVLPDAFTPVVESDSMLAALSDPADTRMGAPGRGRKKRSAEHGAGSSNSGSGRAAGGSSAASSSRGGSGGLSSADQGRGAGLPGAGRGGNRRSGDPGIRQVTDPEVQAKIAEWRARCARAERSVQPLLQLLKGEGVQVNAHRVGYVPAVMDVLREEWRRLRELRGPKTRQPFSSSQMAQWLGISASVLSKWGNEEPAAPAAGESVDAPAVQQAVAAWRAQLAGAGILEQSLLDLLRSKGVQTGGVVGTPLVPEVLELLKAEYRKLRQYRDRKTNSTPSNAKLAEWLGVDSHMVAKWQKAEPTVPAAGMRAGDPRLRDAIDAWRAELVGAGLPEQHPVQHLLALLRSLGVETGGAGRPYVPDVWNVLREEGWRLRNLRDSKTNNPSHPRLAAWLGVHFNTVADLLRAAPAAPAGDEVDVSDHEVRDAIDAWWGQLTDAGFPEQHPMQSLLKLLRGKGVRTGGGSGGNPYVPAVAAVIKEHARKLMELRNPETGNKPTILRVGTWVGVHGVMLSRWLVEERRELSGDVASDAVVVERRRPPRRGQRVVGDDSSDLTSLSSSSVGPSVPAADLGDDSSDLTSVSGSFVDSSVPAADVGPDVGSGSDLERLRLVGLWEARARELGEAGVVSLWDFLSHQGVSGFDAVPVRSRGGLRPEWWGVFQESALRMWDSARGVDPRTGRVFGEAGLAELYGVPRTVVRLWLDASQTAETGGGALAGVSGFRVGSQVRARVAAWMPGGGGLDDAEPLVTVLDRLGVRVWDEGVEGLLSAGVEDLLAGAAVRVWAGLDEQVRSADGTVEMLAGWLGVGASQVRQWIGGSSGGAGAARPPFAVLGGDSGERVLVRDGARLALRWVRADGDCFYHSVIETARRHTLRQTHPGVSQLASVTVFGLRRRLARAFQDAVAEGNETLNNLLTAMGLSAERVAADLASMGVWRTVAADLALWLLSREFGVRATHVDNAGWAVDNSGLPAADPAPELLVFRDRDARHYWATESLDEAPADGGLRRGVSGGVRGGRGVDAMDVDDGSDRGVDAMDVDGGPGAGGTALGRVAPGGVSRSAPGWARSGAPFFRVSEPARVRRLGEVAATEQSLRDQLERTVKWKHHATWVVRELHVGAAAPAASGRYEPGAVGFLVTVPVPYRPRGVGYTNEHRSPAELVAMYKKAAGREWESRLRMVIAINRFNDPNRHRAQYRGGLPYGTTALYEQELAEEVDYWQREVDRVAPGVATVIGQMLDPPVWEDGQVGQTLVDADVLRHVMMREPTRYRLRFPFAGVRQAMLASWSALSRLLELWLCNGEVFILLCDSDVVDTTNPAGGNRVSLLPRYAQEIRDSASEGPSPLVRVGGGYDFSPEELEYGPRGAAPPGTPPGRLSDDARLTLVLVEADQLQRQIMDRGDQPMGYFSEQNLLLNSRYVEQVISALGQDVANALGMPDVSLGLHVRLRQLGLLTEEHSRFLADPAARVLTSAHGTKTTFNAHDVREVLRPRAGDAGQITGWQILQPGRTLRRFGVLARHGITFKARNMTFRPMQFLRVGAALGLGKPSTLGPLFDPDTRPQALARALQQIRQNPGTALADQLRAQLHDSGPKVAAVAQLAGAVEELLAEHWTKPVDQLLADLHNFQARPYPDWYLAEFTHRLPEFDPTDELSAALSQLTLQPGPAHPPEPRAADPAVDEITAILHRFTHLGSGHAPTEPSHATPAPSAATDRTQDRGDVPREARAGVAAAPSGAARQSGTKRRRDDDADEAPAKRGRIAGPGAGQAEAVGRADPSAQNLGGAGGIAGPEPSGLDDEDAAADAVVPAAGPADPDDPRFIRALAELSTQLYGERADPRVLNDFRDFITWLVVEEWVDDVPTPAELPGLAADLTGNEKWRQATPQQAVAGIYQWAHAARRS